MTSWSLFSSSSWRTAPFAVPRYERYEEGRKCLRGAAAALASRLDVQKGCTRRALASKTDHSPQTSKNHVDSLLNAHILNPSHPLASILLAVLRATHLYRLPIGAAHACERNVREHNARAFVGRMIRAIKAVKWLGGRSV